MESKGTVTFEKHEEKRYSPWRGNPRKFTPGAIEQREEYRATVIDTNVSIRRNIERNMKNYLYY